MPLVDLDDPEELRARWSALAAVAHATGYDRRWYADEHGWYHQDETGSDLRMVRLDGGRAVLFGFHTQHTQTAEADLLAGSPDWIGQPEVKRRIAGGDLGFVYGSFNGTWARASYPGDPWQPLDDGFLPIGEWITSDEEAAREMVEWAAEWADYLGGLDELLPIGVRLIRTAATTGITPESLLDLFDRLGIGPQSPQHPDVRAALAAAAAFSGTAISSPAPATQSPRTSAPAPRPAAPAAAMQPPRAASPAPAAPEPSSSAPAEPLVDESDDEESVAVPPGISPFTGQPIGDDANLIIGGNEPFTPEPPFASETPFGSETPFASEPPFIPEPPLTPEPPFRPGSPFAPDPQPSTPEPPFTPEPDPDPPYQPEDAAPHADDYGVVAKKPRLFRRRKHEDPDPPRTGTPPAPAASTPYAPGIDESYRSPVPYTSPTDGPRTPAAGNQYARSTGQEPDAGAPAMLPSSEPRVGGPVNDGEDFYASLFADAPAAATYVPDVVRDTPAAPDAWSADDATNEIPVITDDAGDVANASDNTGEVAPAESVSASDDTGEVALVPDVSTSDDTGVIPPIPADEDDRPGPQNPFAPHPSASQPEPFAAFPTTAPWSTAASEPTPDAQQTADTRQVTDAGLAASAAPYVPEGTSGPSQYVQPADDRFPEAHEHDQSAAQRTDDQAQGTLEALQDGQPMDGTRFPEAHQRGQSAAQPTDPPDSGLEARQYDRTTDANGFPEAGQYARTADATGRPDPRDHGRTTDATGFPEAGQYGRTADANAISDSRDDAQTSGDAGFTEASVHGRNADATGLPEAGQYGPTAEATGLPDPRDHGRIADSTGFPDAREQVPASGGAEIYESGDSGRSADGAGIAEGRSGPYSPGRGQGEASGTNAAGSGFDARHDVPTSAGADASDRHSRPFGADLGPGSFESRQDPFGDNRERGVGDALDADRGLPDRNAEYDAAAEALAETAPEAEYEPEPEAEHVPEAPVEPAKPEWIGGAWINGVWVEDVAAYLAAQHAAGPAKPQSVDDPPTEDLGQVQLTDESPTEEHLLGVTNRDQGPEGSSAEEPPTEEHVLGLADLEQGAEGFATEDSPTEERFLDIAQLEQADAPAADGRLQGVNPLERSGEVPSAEDRLHGGSQFEPAGDSTAEGELRGADPFGRTGEHPVAGEHLAARERLQRGGRYEQGLEESLGEESAAGERLQRAGRYEQGVGGASGEEPSAEERLRPVGDVELPVDEASAHEVLDGGGQFERSAGEVLGGELAQGSGQVEAAQESATEERLQGFNRFEEAAERAFGRGAGESGDAAAEERTAGVQPDEGSAGVPAEGRSSGVAAGEQLAGVPAAERLAGAQAEAEPRGDYLGREPEGESQGEVEDDAPTAEIAAVVEQDAEDEYYAAGSSPFAPEARDIPPNGFSSLEPLGELDYRLGDDFHDEILGDADWTADQLGEPQQPPAVHHPQEPEQPRGRDAQEMQRPQGAHEANALDEPEELHQPRDADEAQELNELRQSPDERKAQGLLQSPAAHDAHELSDGRELYESREVDESSEPAAAEVTAQIEAVRDDEQPMAAEVTAQFEAVREDERPESGEYGTRNGAPYDDEHHSLAQPTDQAAEAAAEQALGQVTGKRPDGALEGAAEVGAEADRQVEAPVAEANGRVGPPTAEADRRVEASNAEVDGLVEAPAAERPEKLVVPDEGGGAVAIPGLGVVGGDGPRVETPPGSIEEAMRAEVERPRPRPKESAAYQALREWCRARTKVVPSGFTIQVQVLDPAAPSYRFDLEPPEIDDPQYSAEMLTELLGDLWIAESQGEQGGWLFARMDAAGRTLRIDRWYDSVPDWWDNPVESRLDLNGLVRRLNGRGPDWQPSYLEKLYTSAR